MLNQLLQGDNLNILQEIPPELVDLAYLDPPFFTGKSQNLLDRTLAESEGGWLSFNDVWSSQEEYLEWVEVRLREVRRVLKPTGSIFLQCDWHASHHLRVLLDKIFGVEQFRGEIIWHYKRWTNTARILQRAHQTIFFYSKTDAYKFNTIYEDYSFTTNIDQIWQKRGRDPNGKSVTMTSENGEYVSLGQSKLGVPMRDVWEIPYLNPRAKERTGWPTQKPLELLRRIILSATDEGDIVLDPVCGSGTTLVAAKSLKRQWIGIDCSHEAIEISKRRLEATPALTKDNHHAPYRLARFLKLSRSAKVEYIAERLDMHIVQRNGNIDGFLKKTIDGANVAVRYVESDEPKTVINQFVQAIEKKHSKIGIVVMSQVSKKEKEGIENRFGASVQIFVISYQDICEKNFNIEDVINGRQLTLAL